MVKQWIKRILKCFFEKSAKLRNLAGKLNKMATEAEPMHAHKSASITKVDIVPDELYTAKALFRGDNVSYLNMLTHTKAERARDLKTLFYNNCRYYLDLDNPRTFNQKIQWLKLNYYDPDMSRAVDKCEFKNYIEERFGAGYTVPMYGAWEDENDIDFNALPSKFVLKSNIQSDGKLILLVEDKSTLDLDKLKTVLNTWLLNRNTLHSSFCEAYKTVKPMILAEEYLMPASGDIVDYKFYCYGGKCRHFLVCEDRKTKTKYTNYDLDFNCIKLSPNSHVTDKPFEKPESFDQMMTMAEQLAKPFPLARVDFYDMDGKLYVGELTFYPGGGFNSYYREWDEKLGEYLVLPEANI